MDEQTMPELPEVETTLRGIKPHVLRKRVIDVIIRHPRLRWPIPADLKSHIEGKVVRNIKRRGKYLLLRFDTGTLIFHLGMSGRLCILSNPTMPQKHDHVDIAFANKKYLRFTDPRRFGALLFTSDDPEKHPLLASIGPEPLTTAFHGDYLWERGRGKKMPVKSYIMDSKTVAGVGNIYATEALFQARIRPQTAAGKVSRAQYQKLASAIKSLLQQAIEKGGTTLKDFMKPSGSPGYFSIELQVYGHAGKPCPRCHAILKSVRLGQRSTVYCTKCQR
jgi:formamidopyrimidine-DNA glycosylase